jgi:hypothetical protein
MQLWTNMRQRNIKKSTAAQWAPAALAGGIVAFALAGAASAADVAGNVFQDGKAGFVVSHIAYALSKDASETGACPDGMSLGPAQIYAASPEGKRHEGESDQDYTRRLNQGSLKVSTAPDGRNLCMNPEAGAPDPNFRIVTGANVPADGIDLDGQDSRVKGKPAPGTCPHDDFRGMNGEKGIDNQFFRLVGCSNSFQSTGQSNTYEITMYTGSWGILLTLSGVDNIKNDPDVEVGIYANADPIQLSPTREALPNATYAIDQNPRFQAKAHGRIVNGVLTTDPVDVRFHWDVNSIYIDRPLHDARLRLTFAPGGGLEGILAGYADVEELYDFQYGFRTGKDSAGRPANQRLILGSANGQARVLGHTCNGAYFAMKQLADGHRDPKTGQCTALSMQYRIKAIPAFVVNTQTQSVNATLDKP